MNLRTSLSRANDMHESLLIFLNKIRFNFNNVLSHLYISPIVFTYFNFNMFFHKLSASIFFPLQLREVDEIESILDTFEFTAPRISSSEFTFPSSFCRVILLQSNILRNVYNPGTSQFTKEILLRNVRTR